MSPFDYLVEKAYGMSHISWYMVLIGLVAIYAVKRYFAPSPLASIPGPQSPSFFIGHLLSLTSGRNDMAYFNQITEQYGGVVKLNTLFGVCHTCSFVHPRLLTLELQGNLLYVSDPLALQHIEKEIEIFRKPPYVVLLLSKKPANVGIQVHYCVRQSQY